MEIYDPVLERSITRFIDITAEYKNYEFYTQPLNQKVVRIIFNDTINRIIEKIPDLQIIRQGDYTRLILSDTQSIETRHNCIYIKNGEKAGKYSLCATISKYDKYLAMRYRPLYKLDDTDKLNSTLARLDHSFQKYRYLFIEGNDISLCVEKPFPIEDSLIVLNKFTQHTYIFSILFGYYFDMCELHALQSIIWYEETAMCFYINYDKYSIIYDFINNKFVYTDENLPPQEISILYDKKTDTVYPLFSYSISYIHPCEDLDTYSLPSHGPTLYVKYIDIPDEFTTFLYFHHFFSVFINKYRFLFVPISPYSLKESEIKNLTTLLIGKQIPKPVNKLKSNEGVYFFREDNILDTLDLYLKRFNSELIYRKYPHYILITKRTKIHLSIFKEDLVTGWFHLTNEKTRRHVFFQMNAKSEILIDRKVSLEELADRIDGDIHTISFYYAILISFIHHVKYADRGSLEPQHHVPA